MRDLPVVTVKRGLQAARRRVYWNFSSANPGTRGDTPALLFMPEIINDFACTVCGCVCDDLRLTISGGRIVGAEGACALAEPRLLEQDSRRPAVAAIRGQPVSCQQGIAEAARILRGSRAPLIYGLSRSSTPGQRAAVRLADRLGGTIDTTASLCHAPSIMALQQVGESTCSLGEIRNRADLVIYWGSNPMVSHPRHMERYALAPTGQFVTAGRGGRTLVVIDVVETATSALADVFLRMEPHCDFDAIWALRMLLRGEPLPTGRALGLPREALEDLAQRMRECRFGVVFFGLGLTRHGVGHANVEALLRLVRDLNGFTRFQARRMRVYGDVAGADSVLCWQTGFPFSVNLARGYPRFNPGEYSANDVLARHEADACLLVGSEGVAQLSAPARDWLARIPTIALDHPMVDPPLAATVQFTTAMYGIHRRGTAYRMDEIPIPLRGVLTSDYPSDDELLGELQLLLAGEVAGEAPRILTKT